MSETFFTKLGIDGIANSLCACLITVLNFFHFTQDSMMVFICYLILDTFWRYDSIPREIIVHHIISFVITMFGFYSSFILIGENRAKILIIASELLSMEATSPILYVGKALKSFKMLHFATIFLVLLIFAWIPFRILGPLRALNLTFRFFPHWRGVQTVIIMLTILQIVWLARLFAVARDFMKSKNGAVSVSSKNSETSLLEKNALRSHEA
jgi:hypothetical protein